MDISPQMSQMKIDVQFSSNSSSVYICDICGDDFMFGRGVK